MEFLERMEDVEDEELKSRIGKGDNPTHISLFSGCGSMDLGLKQAGFENRVMVEFAHEACETLRTNFTHKELSKRDEYPEWMNPGDREPVIIEKDIREVNTQEILKAADLRIGECSVISGGFPCQGFSLAGKRKVADPRNSLYLEFVRIVNESKPAMFIGENVPGIVSMMKGKVIERICDDFANCGYDITWDILNAADFGVPQNRKRVFLIGKRVDGMIIKDDVSIQLHMGSQKGEIKHPELFYKRKKRWEAEEKKIKRSYNG